MDTVIKIRLIFVGSDGHKASNAAKIQLKNVLLSLKDDIASNPLQALKQAFALVNEELSNDSTWDAYLSGTTAVVAIIVGELVHVAHVGDSRLVLISKHNSWEAKQITVYFRIFKSRDHTCENESEKARVLKAGGRVEALLKDGIFDGPLRIFKGSLPYPGYFKICNFRITVTRSLGDSAAQRIGVICEPEVTTLKLSKEDKYLVLASDGLWDGLSIEETVKCIAECKDSADCALVLMKAGLEGLNCKQIDDNITHIVVDLKDFRK